jgi:glycosyltransferase involved in cell wall biosynthesis
VKKKFDIPLVVGLHSDLLDNPLWLKEQSYYRVMNKLGKRILKKADAVRCVSNQIKQNIMKLGIPEDKIVVAPTGGGVNLDFFEGADGSGFKEKYKGELILFVGRIAKAKNLEMLLDVADIMLKKRPEAKFLIAGDGPEKKGLEAKAKDLSNVIFMGHVRFEQLPDLYAAADVAVLTSNYEGFPKTVEEAFAVGTPFVSTRVSGSTDLITEGKTGYLVDIGDAQGFADKLDLLLSDKKKAEEMGAAGKKLIEENYDRKKNFKRMYLEFYGKPLK